MQFKYTAQYIPDYGMMYMPRVNVFVKNRKNDIELPFLALIDSGASDTLLHSQIGEELGIDTSSGEYIELQGVGGVVAGYRHKIGLRLAGEKQVRQIECVFASLQGVDALLGERGFFENYRVVFELYKNTFSVTARKT